MYCIPNLHFTVKIYILIIFSRYQNKNEWNIRTRHNGVFQNASLAQNKLGWLGLRPRPIHHCSLSFFFFFSFFGYRDDVIIINSYSTKWIRLQRKRRRDLPGCWWETKCAGGPMLFLSSVPSLFFVLLFFFFAFCIFSILVPPLCLSASLVLGNEAEDNGVLSFGWFLCFSFCFHPPVLSLISLFSFLFFSCFLSRFVLLVLSVYAYLPVSMVPCVVCPPPCVAFSLAFIARECQAFVHTGGEG